MVRQALLAESVTVHALDQACGVVVRVANDTGTMIAAVLGGATPFMAGGQDAMPVSNDTVGPRTIFAGERNNRSARPPWKDGSRDRKTRSGVGSARRTRPIDS